MTALFCRRVPFWSATNSAHNALMGDFAEAFRTAGRLILGRDPALFAIVRLSLIVSLSAVLFAALIGVPLGALHGAHPLSRPRGRDRRPQRVDGLPPVVVGLAVFLTLSRSGPLGSWGLLFTPQAMVIAQTDSGCSDHRRADATDHRRFVGRISGRAGGDECRPARAGSRR